MTLKQFTGKGLLLISFSLLGTAFCAAFETKELNIVFKDSAAFTISDKMKPSDAGEFSGMPLMTEGVEHKPVVFEKCEVSSSGNTSSLSLKSRDFSWKLNFIPRGRVVLIESEIKNDTDKELWLEPSLKFSLPGNKKLKKFWAGNNTSLELEKGKELIRKGIKNKLEKHVGASTMPFPTAALFGDNSAVFAGSLPFDPISYYACRCMPWEKAIDMEYSIRLIVGRGESKSFRMLLGTCSAKYGGMDAVVQAYYDSFPEIWKPVVGQDSPYIWGLHGHYLNWWEKPDYEKSRRLYVVNEWTYCPYKRSGDMRCDKDLWDYTAHNKFKQHVMMGGQKINTDIVSMSDFLKLRRETFLKYAKEFGWMFYNTVAGTWAEIQLAREKYPDAIVHDKSVMYILNTWSTHHDQEIRVFPMGTSFAEVFKKDMKYLAKELDLPGFALDCAYAGAYYRGPAVKKDLPGKAWDEEGVFIDQSVAINHEVDFIHNIDSKEKLVAFSNGYLKGDYLMIESPFVGMKFRRWMPLLRYHIGPRPGCTHGHGYCIREIIPNWRDKTTEDFKKFIPKLADYIIFNQFKYGVTSSHLEIYGNPQILYVIPELIEMMRAGWQAYIPVSFERDEKIFYTARYGKGAGTFLFLGNPYDEDTEKIVRIDNRGISPENNDSYVFLRKMRDAAVTASSIKGDFSVINMKMPSRTPVLYEAVCALELPSGTTCEASSKKDIDTQSYRISMNPPKSFSSTVKIRKIRNFKLESVKCGGKPVPFKETEAGYLTAECDFAEKGVLEISYKSSVFHISAEKLLAFPFVDKDKKVSFTLGVTSTPNAAEKNAAEKFTGYFKFCAEKKVINPKSLPVEVTETGNIPKQSSKPFVVIISGKGRIKGDDSIPYGVSMSQDGRILFVKTDSPEKMESLLKEVFHVMDRRFPYIFPFRAVMGLYQNMLNHFKMNGKYMPYRKYFEQ